MTDNIKRVTLPSGREIGMPEHITDYIEPAAVNRKEFDVNRLTPLARHYLIVNKKRSVYTKSLPDNGRRA